MPNTTLHHLLAILLHELESAGYPLGAAKYLQVQELLRQAPADLALEQWRGLLAPLFSSSPLEQEEFYRLFERCINSIQPLVDIEKGGNNDDKKEDVDSDRKFNSKLGWILFMLPIVSLLLGLVNSNAIRWWNNNNIWFLFCMFCFMSLAITKTLEKQQRIVISILFTIIYFFIGQEGISTFLKTLIPTFSVKDYQCPLGDEIIIQGIRPDNNRLKLIKTDTVYYLNDGILSVDTYGATKYISHSHTEIGNKDSMLVIFTFQNETDTVLSQIEITKIGDQSKTIQLDTGLIAELPLPYPQNDTAFANLRLDEQALKNYELYQRWQWPLKILFLFLLGLLVWAILRWDQYRRAKAVAELKRPDRAPYVWSPETGIDATEYLHGDAAPLLARLRGRSLDERMRLDLAATVQFSIRAGGRIHLRYRRQTLPPDYLLLIDRHDAQDHRARLFEALFQVFLRAEAPVSRYFYDGDPRLCFDDAHPGGIALSELFHRHAGAQLLLVGEGQGLISNLSGRVAPWTSLLQAWPRRALLLTKPMQAWGRREKELQALLPLLPASPAGLGAAIDLFNTEDSTILNPDLLKAIPDALQQPFEFEFELLTDLQRHFSTAYIDWIAACALWPTLHWDLTMHLGTKVAELTGSELLHFAGIRELTRLPWFVEGRIPDAARILLIGHLQTRGLELPLRQALRELLQQVQPPPPEANAYDDYRMNLVLNELFLHPDKAKKRELEREFARYLAAGKKPDFVALKLLNRPQTLLDVVVGDGLKKYATKTKTPISHWRILPLSMVLYVLGMGAFLFSPIMNPCTGEKVRYKEKVYCLNDIHDQLLYLEQLAADAILAQQHGRVDSIVNEAKNVPMLFNNVSESLRQFYVNTATNYYNFGAKLYNCIRQQDSSCQYPAGFNPDSAVCNNFSQGSSLFKLANNKTGLKYYQAMLKTCQVIDTSATVPIPAMVRIPAGSFTMGDQFGDGTSREKPVHTVRLDAFEIGTYEVTFAEYDLFCEATKREKPNDGGWGRGSRPAMRVSWLDAVAYCNWLSEQHGYQPVYSIKGSEVTANWNANGYRLPTEAEWEYAARGGGKKVRFGNGKDIADPKEINFNGEKDYKQKYSLVGEYREKTVPVGSLNSPNALGLHDMSGNVWEWCWDGYAENYYRNSPAQNPRGPNISNLRVLRGGSWNYYPDGCRASCRDLLMIGDPFNDYIGFRLAKH